MKKNILLNSLSSVSLQLVRSLTSLITAKLFLETFGSDVNGLTNSLVQFLNYVVLIEAGCSTVVRTSIYKGLANDDFNYINGVLSASKVFHRNIGRSIVIYTFLLGLTFPFIAKNEFSFKFVFTYTLVLGSAKVFDYFIGATDQIFLQAELKQYLTNFIRCILTIINCIVLLFLIGNNASIHTVKFVSALIFLACPIIISVYIKRIYPQVDYKVMPNHSALKERWSAFAQHIAYFVNANTDILIITMVMGLKEVSIYSVYFVIINMIITIISSATNSLTNLIGRSIAKQDVQATNKLIDKVESVMYLSVNILFNCCQVLIVPFIYIYTINVVDTNYINYSFAISATLYGAISILRSMYHGVVQSAGHFKQARISSYLEPIINISVTLILVTNMGITGVVIATIVSSTFKLLCSVVYISRNIVHRSTTIFYRRMLVSSLIAIATHSVALRYRTELIVDSFFEWCIIASVVFITVSVSTLLINSFLFKDDIKAYKSFFCKQIYIKEK